MSDLHWRQLKKLVEDNGGEYVDKEQAIAFLSEKGIATDAPETVPVAKGDSTIMLDRAKPFGSICGEMEEAPTARYAQDGHLFDATGRKVG